MWYDKAIKAYIDREWVTRNRGSIHLKRLVKKVFDEDIEPNSGVYIFAYHLKRMGVRAYYDNGKWNIYLFKDVDLEEGTYYVSKNLEDMYHAGEQLVRQDTWRKAKMPKVFIRDLT